MKLAVLILLTAATTFLLHTIKANPLDDLIRSEYEKFKIKYGVSSSSGPIPKSLRYLQRRNSSSSDKFKSFKENFERIHMFNYQAEQEKLPFRLGINRFADLSHDEFTKIFTGYIPESKVLKKSPKLMRRKKRPHHQWRRKTTTTTADYYDYNINNNNNEIPTSIDWRDRHVVNPIKSQGPCGACWAFSAVGALESQYAIQTGDLLEFSEQQLVDCSSNDIYLNGGCEGGLMSWAYNYIINKGEMGESAYPYVAKQGSCRYSKPKVEVYISSYQTLYNEAELLQAVGTIGPVTAALYASPNFQSYASGVLDDPLCLPDSTPNHAIVIIGYGSENGKDYWILRNSWGTEWGENGYAKLLRGVNMCKIESELLYPVF